MGLRQSATNQVILALNGEPAILGTITNTSGTAKDNLTTAVPFTITANNQVILLQSDAPVYVQICAAASYTASGASSIYLDAYEKLSICLKTDTVKITCDALSGTANVKVFGVV